MLHSRISRSIIGNCSTRLCDDLKEYHIKFQTFELDFSSDDGTWRGLGGQKFGK